MKKSNSNSKALSAFKKLGAVALITATLAMCFTACNQTGGTGGGGEKPTPKPKHAITFGVEGSVPNGMLTAKADGIAETSTSPITVEEGKVITFTAKASDGYRVKGWTLDGNAITEAGTNTEYKLKVSKPATVTVSFESNGTTPTPMPQAVLTLDPDNLNIKIRVVTEDDSDVQVEGCNKTTLKSKDYTSLRANGTTVTLKGKITELDCDENKLTAVGVQGLTSLKELSCSKNQLIALNVSGLTALQKLKCQGNQLTSLDVKDLTTLQVIWCQDNQLTEINVSGLTALQELNCGNNKLTALGVQGLTALQELNCGNNKLTALNVQGLTALQNFSCSARSNRIEKV